jgi:hypothetical protein
MRSRVTVTSAVAVALRLSVQVQRKIALLVASGGTLAVKVVTALVGELAMIVSPLSFTHE